MTVATPVAEKDPAVRQFPRGFSMCSGRPLPTPRFSLGWLLGLTAVAAFDAALINAGLGMVGLALTLFLLLCVDFKSEKFRCALAALCFFAHLLMMEVSKN